MSRSKKAVFKFGQYTQWTKKVATKKSMKYTNYVVRQGTILFRSGMELHAYVNKKMKHPRIELNYSQKKTATKYGITEAVLQT